MSNHEAFTYVEGIFFLLVLLGIVIFVATIYFLPWLLGKKRDINYTGWLFFVNLLIGWSLIGWLVCLLWAALGETKAREQFFRKEPVF